MINIFKWLILLASSITLLQAQEIICLSNPSFEFDTIRWNQGMDVQVWNGLNENNLPPAQGKQFLSLKVKETGDVEQIGQQLSESLIAGRLYHLDLKLAQFGRWREGVDSLNFEDFSNAVGILIIGTSKEGTSDTLAFTPEIRHQVWQNYPFVIRPQIDVTQLRIQAYHLLDMRYNGHVLLDDLSCITEVGSQSELEQLTLADTSRLINYLNLLAPNLLPERYMVLREVDRINQLLPKEDLRRFPVVRSYEELNQLTQLYRYAKAPKVASVLRSIWTIYNLPDGTRTGRDIRFFNTANQQFRAALKDAQMDTALSDYLIYNFEGLKDLLIEEVIY